MSTQPIEQSVAGGERGRGGVAVQEPLPLEADGIDRPAASRFRWVILGMVFLAITINYVDRMVLGFLKPQLEKEFGLTDANYGYITAAFSLSYAFGQTISGRWLDWIGTRTGYAIALVSWSLAAMAHALVRGPWGFGFARAALGVTESPAFPAATKTIAEWFPKKERAFAMGFVNAGANVGAVVAPAAVPWLAQNWGWQSAFVVTGAVGLLWIGLWLPLYRRPRESRRVSAAELAHIESDPPDAPGKVRWLRLLQFRQAWAFAVGKFMTDPIWSFYLFWLPTFFKDNHKVDLKTVAAPMITIYLMADVGSIAGGWLSSFLIKRGWSVNAARKTTLLACAVCIIPSAFISLTTNLWTAVFLAGVALAAHQGWSSNLYTLVSDTFPKKAVGSVAGFGGTWGYIGTSLFMALVGWILTVTVKNYLPIFIMASSAYLVALVIIHLLMPGLEPAAIDEEPGARGFDVLPPKV